MCMQCMEAGDGTSYTAGMREAALHATAGRCPNIVSLLDAFEHRSSSGRHPVMVLERCGANLLVVSGLGRFLERGRHPHTSPSTPTSHHTFHSNCD